ncbi:unnamed protein product [Parascedosporium putredinis]|uniref:Uncharacterized protein n=1 Tax=Parascedosporium putredinis TaxID=1442378 RepID=A0A9P1HBJ9_9PEZI|nr:unnamed protein product [Parascedosporium putredinis]CAI8002157.1 unnamed protein product [Parascedosporium putredinis]
MTSPTEPKTGRPRRQTFTRPDPIDVLDNTPIGGAYHHGGPYDATLAANNLNSNHPARLRQRLLTKHVPLQGTATVPPGHADFDGQIMDYEEGADLMREPDAKGGAYKRWEGVPYHPDDLKGKGEPSYTFEESEKSRRRLRNSSGNSPTADSGSAYEMTRGPHLDSKGFAKNSSVEVRKRSVSDVPKYTPVDHDDASSGGHHHLGLRRRWGSLRRKAAS